MSIRGHAPEPSAAATNEETAIMKRTREVSKKLFIEELEKPVPAMGTVTTLAVGEECLKGGGGPITTLALGEECLKA